MRTHQKGYINWSLLPAFAVIIVGTSGFTMSSNSPKTRTMLVDPMVIVVKDATPLDGSCKITTTIHPGASDSVTQVTKCPPDTVLHAEIVYESQAIQARIPFVVVPSEHASDSELRSTYAKVDNLYEQARPPAVLTSSCITGLKRKSITQAIANNNDVVYMEIDYNVSTSCSSVTLDTSYERVPSGDYIWGNWAAENEYGAGLWDLCAPLNHDTMQYAIDQSHTTNLEFIFGFTDTTGAECSGFVHWNKYTLTPGYLN